MSEPSHCQAPRFARRTPTQARGQQKLEALLGAAAALLEEQGYDGLTTKAIAERAGTSIGSFYQFFPNKEAVVNELVLRYRGRVHRFLSDAVEQSADGGMSTAWAQSLIVGLAGIYRDLPGFQGVWMGRFRSGPLREQADALRHEVFVSLDEALGNAFPAVAVEDRRRCLTMSLETAKLLLESTSSSAERKALINGELKRMLGLYIASYFAA